MNGIKILIIKKIISFSDDSFFKLKFLYKNLETIDISYTSIK
jgi:hypothetical protein